MVMITSRAGDKHREKALDLGVSDYLAKPYDDSELISIVERLSTKEQGTDLQNIPVVPFVSNDLEVIDFH
jgi:DNA-binding response OmpR family regulator